MSSPMVMPNPSLTTQDTEMTNPKKQITRYKVYCYMGGSGYRDEIRWTNSLSTAKLWATTCQHSEIVDTHDNYKFIDPYEEG
jgi:hypothetical protein